MDEKVTEFGKLCRSYRSLKGLTMAQFSKGIGKHQSDITKIEHGEIPISIDYIRASIEAYGIEDKNKQLEFLQCYFNCSERLEIQLGELGSLRKEWLAALCILGDVNDKNPEGWDNLLEWLNSFFTRLKALKPKFISLGDSVKSI
jgi:transcriptional regulator with XRE-family HTH domain